MDTSFSDSLPKAEEEIFRLFLRDINKCVQRKREGLLRKDATVRKYEMKHHNYKKQFKEISLSLGKTILIEAVIEAVCHYYGLGIETKLILSFATDWLIDQLTA